MNCIVTAGPTIEPLDEVRRLTNFSTGRLGTELANFLADEGHRVTLLLSETATWGGERRAQTVKRFATTRDLRARLRALAGRKVDAVFHAAAVSDFTFGKLFVRAAGGGLRPARTARKISTREGGLLAELMPTPKVIAELRQCFPGATIVGWKFEADGGRGEVLRRARRQIADCATDACVANGPAYGRGFGLVTARGQTHAGSAPELFAALAEVLRGRRDAAG